MNGKEISILIFYISQYLGIDQSNPVYFPLYNWAYNILTSLLSALLCMQRKTDNLVGIPYSNFRILLKSFSTTISNGGK